MAKRTRHATIVAAVVGAGLFATFFLPGLRLGRIFAFRDVVR